MGKTVFLLMVLTLGSRLLGLGREMTLSYFYGAANISDAYLISLTVPTVVLGFIASGISTGYIPIYRQLESADKTGIQARNFTNQIINSVWLLCGFIFILGTIFTPQLVQLFASGFDLETLKITNQLTRITLLGVFFTGITAILLAYLQVNQKFLAAALVGIPFNVVMILFIVMSSRTGFKFLAIGSVLAVVAQVLFLVILTHWQGFRYRLKFSLRDEYIRQTVMLAFPVIIGTSAEQINCLVDKTLASQVAVGGSALAYAYRIMSAVQGIFIVSVLTVMYPHIAKLAAEKNMTKMKKSIYEAIIGVSLFVIPAVIGIMFLARPVVLLLYGRGAFTDEAVVLTAQAVFFSIISMFGNGIQDILARAFYSLQDAKTPMINASIALSFNIVLNLILVKIMGISGLALATSLVAITAMVLMWHSLHKKIGPLNEKAIFSTLIKIVIASAFMGGVSRISYNYLTTVLHSNIALLLAIGAGAGIYFILIMFMKITEATIVLKSFLKLIRRKLRG